MSTVQTLEVPGYQVIQFLGNGAKSSIWQIRERETGRMLALKRVVRHSSADNRFIDQVVNEYEVGHTLDHPTIRKIHRLHRIKRWLALREVHLFMEWCPGQTLKDTPPQDIREALKIFHHVGEALIYMNSRGFVHADMKPNNIIVASDGAVKIIDLGQSCPIGTIKERIQGTPDFIAPEQVQRHPLDARTDAFNFGAALYRTLTGKAVPTILPDNPSNLKSDYVVLPPEKLNDQVPSSLSKLVLECVEMNPAHRPASMSEVTARLGMILLTLDRHSTKKATMPNPVADIFHRAAELCLHDPRRNGNIVELEEDAEILLSGDLHGHRNWLTRIIQAADLGKNPRMRLVLQELIHGPLDGPSNQDRSIDLLLRSVRLMISQPRQVLFLMGNHDLAQATGNEINKDGRSVCRDFAAGVSYAFGNDGAEVLAAVNEFLLAMPLAIRCANKVLLAHSLPSPHRMKFAGVDILSRPIAPGDLNRGGAVYEWTWGRGQTPEQLDALAQSLGVEFFILGHRHVPNGFELIPNRAVTIASDHEAGCVVCFRSNESLCIETIPQHIQALAGLTGVPPCPSS